jgi:ABC-type transporter Mla subunit MlaD
MSAGAHAEAVDTFERALFVSEAIGDLDRIRAQIDDATLAVAAARELVDRRNVARLLGSLRRTGASEAEVDRLREAFQALRGQLTDAASPVHVARASAGQLAEELQGELADARSALHTQTARPAR